MNRYFYLFLISMSFLFLSCDKKVVFNDYKNEVILDIEGYNEIVRIGAKTEFKNYRFVDLRTRASYLTLYVSNFYYKYNIHYQNLDDIDKIVEAIEENNKAGFTMPIILLDSGIDDDFSSNIVYDELIKRGYLNVKNIEIGFKGLKEGYQIGFPYNLKDGSDCGC